MSEAIVVTSCGYLLSSCQAGAECQYLERLPGLALVLIRSHLEIIIKPLASSWEMNCLLTRWSFCQFSIYLRYLSDMFKLN